MVDGGSMQSSLVVADSHGDVPRCLTATLHGIVVLMRRQSHGAILHNECQLPSSHHKPWKRSHRWPFRPSPGPDLTPTPRFGTGDGPYRPGSLRSTDTVERCRAALGTTDDSLEQSGRSFLCRNDREGFD